MKNLCFVVVTISFFLATTNILKAQTAVNTERTNINKPIKFIEHIEITPTALKKANNTATLANAHNIEIAQNLQPQSNPAKSNIEYCTMLQFKYAMLMDIDVEAVTNIALYTAIEDWWATKYKFGGTTKSGIDCSAFCGKIFGAAYSTTLPRTAREQYALCSKIARVDLQEGDLVFFNTRGGVSHVGIYLGNDCFVHSSVHSGVTINKLTDDYYSRKFIIGGRIH
jgi:cell wall-associated NlpC family hydrolase